MAACLNILRQVWPCLSFVVTDDGPANPREFARTIAATTFPVLGVNLAKEPSTGTYTRSVAAEPGADLQEKLRQRATEVLLQSLAGQSAAATSRTFAETLSTSMPPLISVTTLEYV
jgi:hypothetical protein